MKVLDHGYVEVIETWGSDERIIEAARMSTSGGFVSWNPYEGHPKGDAGLLSYLYKNKHMTPFEMAGLVLEVQAPIFVFREWHRHRTQSYNEMSARYIPLPDVNYLPYIPDILQRCIAGANKQAGQAVPKLPHTGEVLAWHDELIAVYKECQRVYERGLALGIPKEIARLPVPVARYSRMRASANLRNWLQFLTLRQDPGAQWEIRQYAEAVGTLVKQYFPRTYALFKEK